MITFWMQLQSLFFAQVFARIVQYVMNFLVFCIFHTVKERTLQNMMCISKIGCNSRKRGEKKEKIEKKEEFSWKICNLE